MRVFYLLTEKKVFSEFFIFSRVFGRQINRTSGMARRNQEREKRGCLCFRGRCNIL
jgi:hypothetical protein